MSKSHIIQDALNYYDAGRTVIGYLKSTDTVTATLGTDNKRGLCTFTKNGKVVFESEYEYMAVFYSKVNVWAWAWSQATLSLGENYLSKEILYWALSLKSDMLYFKNLITTSRRIVNDPIQIDINVAICSSIAKQQYIYPFMVKTSDEDYIVSFLFLTNTEELDKIRDKIEKNIST